MWEIYQQAEKWSKLPSEIVFIEDWYDARAINQAVWHFGRALETALEQAGTKEKTEQGRKARRLAVLERWLSTGGPQAKRHRDPATSTATVKRA